MKKILAIVLVIMCVAGLAACKGAGAVYDIGNTDRANYYQNTYNEYVEMYGEAKLADDATYGKVLTGVAVVRLLDFTGDGIYELFIAYADGTVPYVNKQVIVGFDRGAATLIGEETEFSDDITSTEASGDEAPCLWLYTSSYDRSYVVTGENMATCAEYNTFVQIRNGEKVYKFMTEFTQKDGATLDGTYEKIDFINLTQEDADLVFEENDKVVKSIKSQAD